MRLAKPKKVLTVSVKESTMQASVILVPHLPLEIIMEDSISYTLLSQRVQLILPKEFVQENFELYSYDAVSGKVPESINECESGACPISYEK